MATFACRIQYLDDRDPFANTNFPEPTRPPIYSFLDDVPLMNQIASIHRLLQAPHQLEDCALQLYRNQTGTQGEYGIYLDLESTLDEQAEELEGFTDQKKNAIILRTQLTVRVNSIIEKLLTSNGRELRRALFSLKQIFQDDKDLVHEFVNNDGLTCMIKVGSESDQNYQNYILRALGQVMLYVDGMEGLIRHNATVQWLYSLLASKVRLVVKTALKLLLVFVEYTESNTVQLLGAIEAVDSRRGLHPWTNVMALLNEKDGADSELLIYTMTLINKVISAIPDQDTFYDVTDALEELGMDAVTHRLMNKQGADLDLLAQFQLYESALKLEDGDDNSVISQVENLRQVPRKKSESNYARKSKRQQGGLELSLPDYSQSQSQAPGLPPDAVKRKDEKRESLGELQLPDRNELNQRVHLQTIEKTSPTSQRKSISPQNARNRRMSRQRIFMEEKHELLAVVDKQDQNLKESNMATSETNLESRFKPSQGFPTPFFQAQKPPNVHLQTETLPQSFPAASSMLSTMSTDTSLSRSVYGSDVAHTELNIGSRTSYDYNRAPEAVSRELHNSYNGLHFSNNRQPEQPQDLSEFRRAQDVLDSAQSASSVSYLSSSAGVQSNKSTNSANFSHPQHHHLTQEEVPVDKPHLNTNQHQNPHQQSHHPHFHNHYHSLDYSTQQGYGPDYQGYVILNNDQSFSSDGNFSSKGLPLNEYRQSSFEDVQKVYLNQNSGQPRGDSQLPDGSYFGDKQDDTATVYSNQRGGVYSQNNQRGVYTQSHQSDLMTSQSHQMVENGFLGTQEGQVRTMQTKLKSEGYEGPREAKRPVGDVSGIISTARNNLNRQASSNKLPPAVTVAEVEKKAESDFQWDRIQRRLNRQLKIKDMDFSDLKDEDDKDIFSSVIFEGSAGGGVSPAPPPPPPIGGIPPAPPPAFGDLPPPPPPLNSLSPSPLVGGRHSSQQFFSSLPPPPGADLKKSKKTLRLHWRALPGDNSHPATKAEVIWKQLVPVSIDTNKLEHLFETRSSELKSKEMKQDGSGKKEITVLDTKRSNAINIGLTVLPPARTIKAAILKMDNSIMNKEGIEKILTTMIPSEEEKAKIIEAQMANPDIPLGTAEQFLLTMSSIFELEARLKLWLFKLDYELSEQEVAEPLMDLKKGIVELRRNKTFKCILSAILTIGNFLNGAAVHAFNIEFLQRLPEIKDTVRKQSLLHHLCTLIIEQFPDTTDLYSEIGPITRCSRVDWDELTHKLNKMENDCKASWDYLQSIVKHDGSTTDLKGKMSTFLADAAERIMILTIIFKRIKNRYNKMLLFMGFPPSEAREMKVNHLCKVISEFALEYRTTRDKVIQMMQKKANQRERKKTRGKMIVDTENFRSKKAANDDALKLILKNGYTGADERGISGQRGRRRPVSDGKSVNTTKGGTTTDSDMFDTGDDEILEACVRSAASAPSSRPQRERRRARTQRKSLRRTLKGGLSLEEQQVLETHDEHV